MPDNPTVSIIIPCYNAEKWVAEAINGILRQTYAPIEIIVIDDGSTDGSLDVIRSFGDRVRYESGPNRGGGAARNRGFALSRGKYVMFHDADDWISEDTIEKLVEGIEGTDNTIVWCDWYIYDAITSKEPRIIPGQYSQITPTCEDLLLSYLEGRGPIVHAILWPRQIIVDIGGWDESLRRRQDVDIYIRALFGGVFVKKIDEGAVYWRQENPNSVHHTNTKNIDSARSYYQLIKKIDKRLMENENKLHLHDVNLAHRYIDLAGQLVYLDITLSKICERRARELAGFQAFSGFTFGPRILSYVFSVSFKEKLADRLAQIGIGRKARKDALERASQTT